MTAPGGIASPCVEVCKLDATGRICIGCLRTLDEIASWEILPPRAREKVMASLAQRRLTFEEAASARTPARCARCGAIFGCGASDPHNACWCTREAPVDPDPALACLCPACLAAARRG